MMQFNTKMVEMDEMLKYELSVIQHQHNKLKRFKLQLFFCHNSQEKASLFSCRCSLIICFTSITLIMRSAPDQYFCNTQWNNTTLKGLKHRALVSQAQEDIYNYVRRTILKTSVRLNLHIHECIVCTKWSFQCPLNLQSLYNVLLPPY